MSHDLTPVPAYSGVVTVPDSGDARTAASVETPFQRLADWSAHACAGVASRLAWADEMSMAPGGSNSSFSLTIGAIQTIVLLNSGGAYHGYSANAATIGASKIEGGGNLANSTWYYVYAYDNAGTVDYLISTTAPRASRQYRNSVDGSQYRYLGCFVTNPSGAPLPFRMHRGKYTYRLSGAAVADIRALNTSTTAGAATDVILARGGTAGQELIPPHARVARVQVGATAAGGNALVLLYTKADTTGLTFRHHIGDGLTTYAELDIETDSSRTVQYTFALSAGTGNAYIFVAGFYE